MKKVIRALALSALAASTFPIPAISQSIDDKAEFLASYLVPRTYFAAVHKYHADKQNLDAKIRKQCGESDGKKLVSDAVRYNYPEYEVEWTDLLERLVLRFFSEEDVEKAFNIGTREFWEKYSEYREKNKEEWEAWFAFEFSKIAARSIPQLQSILHNYASKGECHFVKSGNP